MFLLASSRGLRGDVHRPAAWAERFLIIKILLIKLIYFRKFILWGLLQKSGSNISVILTHAEHARAPYLPGVFISHSYQLSFNSGSFPSTSRIFLKYAGLSSFSFYETGATMMTSAFGLKSGTEFLTFDRYHYCPDFLRYILRIPSLPLQSSPEEGCISDKKGPMLNHWALMRVGTTGMADFFSAVCAAIRTIRASDYPVNVDHF